MATLMTPATPYHELIPEPRVIGWGFTPWYEQPLAQLWAYVTSCLREVRSGACQETRGGLRRAEVPRIVLAESSKSWEAPLPV
jgi:hypothetical protein